MREHWLTSSLSEVIVKTGTIDPCKEPDKKFRYVDVSGISRTKLEITEPTELLGKDAPSRARRLIQKGDVLFATVRPTLKRVAVVPESLDGEVCSTGYFVFRTKPEIENKFLFYYLISDNFMGEMEKIQSGASYPAVNDTQVKQQIISYPPVEEQKRIVAILDETFVGIDAAIANTEKNLTNARELFESYLASVFTKKGEGWSETTLSQATGGIFTGPFGSLLHKSDYVMNEIPLVNPAHITEVGIEADLRKTVSKETAQRLKNYIMREGDIVIGRRGEMGRCALVTEVENGWLCGTGSFFIKSSSQCDSRYLVRLLRSEGCKRRLEKIAGGAVMPNLSNTDLGNFHIDLPPLVQQTAVVQKIDDLHEETQRLKSIYQQKLNSLKELKQSLLQKAFSGELTTEGDKLMDEAVA